MSAVLNVYTDCAEEIARRIATGAEQRGGLNLFYDLDGTLFYNAHALGCHSHEPNVHIPYGMVETVHALREIKGISSFAVSGRSLDFMGRYFSLYGSGQFHAEKTDLQSNQRIILKSEPAFGFFADILDRLAEIHAEHEAWIQDDKSHHRGLMMSAQAMQKKGDGIVNVLKAAVAEYNLAHPDKGALSVIRNPDGVEIGPEPTCKNIAVQELLLDLGNNALPVYIGDTWHTDWPAMERVLERGGIAIGVGPNFKNKVDCWLATPHHVMNALQNLKMRFAL